MDIQEKTNYDHLTGELWTAESIVFEKLFN